MYVGADYYPEHWPKARWTKDAALMRKAGFNVVRLAEFAWVFFEPEEGRFDFGWLDEALAVLRAQGLSAILGTPTAVMPAWCARKYPETLAMQRDGTRQVYGVRKNNCFTSGAYRLLSERVTRAMTEHFKDTPNVIGWQTDNEFGGPVCYCDTCRAAFQDWLRARYGTTGELNRAWGTHFWGHRYGTWGEIPLPVEHGSSNPGALLDWQRFNSWLNVRFQSDQLRILRAVCPRHFATHNFMGLFSDLNYYDLAADLDHVSWDNYPVWEAPAIKYGAALAADVMRGLKKKNFWIMEQTAGPGGWGAFGRNPRPGEIRNVAFQQVAHGADHVIWFRWRSCTAGREQYWHGLLGHDGKPLRRYREAATAAKEFHRLAGLLKGTTLRPQAAIVYDYESIWALRFQPAFNQNNFHRHVERYYQALFRAGVNVDVIKPTDDFTPYRLVLAPQLYILPDPVAKRLSAYVERGGVLLTDLRTGVKDETSLCHARTLPGLLTDALGIVIEEYESLGGTKYSLAGAGPLKGRFTATQYCDWLTPKRAETLAAYDEWHMKEFAAATRNRYGKGFGYYVGTVVEEDGFYDGLLADVLKSARIKPVVKPPRGVEVTVREGQGRKLLFLVNHLEEPATVRIPSGKIELLSGRKTGAEIGLGAYGVAVVRLA